MLANEIVKIDNPDDIDNHEIVFVEDLPKNSSKDHYFQRKLTN